MLFDEEKDNEILQELAKPFIGSAYEAGASAGFGEIGLDANFEQLDPFMQAAVSTLTTKITRVNETTRKQILGVLDDGINKGRSWADLAWGYDEEVDGKKYRRRGVSDVYSDCENYRAEMIARTETRFAYNAGSLDSYEASGITRVEASDAHAGGHAKKFPDDSACRERNGQTFTIDEARIEEEAEHPNGTLIWIPVVDGVNLPQEKAKELPEYKKGDSYKSIIEDLRSRSLTNEEKRDTLVSHITKHYNLKVSLEHNTFSEADDLLKAIDIAPKETIKILESDLVKSLSRVNTYEGHYSIAGLYDSSIKELTLCDTAYKISEKLLAHVITHESAHALHRGFLQEFIDYEGFFNAGEDAITVYANGDPDWAALSWVKGGSHPVTGRPVWKKPKDVSSFVTDYAQTNPEEDFAEHFAFTIQEPAAANEISEDKSKYCKQWYNKVIKKGWKLNA